MQQDLGYFGSGDTLSNERGPAQVCVLCGSASLHPATLSVFGEAVCRNCKFQHDDFKTISKKEAIERFLLPEGRFAELKYESKPNPRNANWTAMRLYLVKHVREAAINRFGSESALEAERERRGGRRYAQEEARLLKGFKLRALHATDSDEPADAAVAAAKSSRGDRSSGEAYAEKDQEGASLGLSGRASKGSICSLLADAERGFQEDLVVSGSSAVAEAPVEPSRKKQKTLATATRRKKQKQALGAMIGSIRASRAVNSTKLSNKSGDSASTVAD